MSLKRSHWVNLMACFEWGLGRGKGSEQEIQDLGAMLASTISKAQWESAKKPQRPSSGCGGVGNAGAGILKDIDLNSGGKLWYMDETEAEGEV